jgi:hypothetical protein
MTPDPDPVRAAEQAITEAQRLMLPGTPEGLLEADAKLDEAVRLLREADRAEKAKRGEMA